MSGHRLNAVETSAAHFAGGRGLLSRSARHDEAWHAFVLGLGLKLLGRVREARVVAHEVATKGDGSTEVTGGCPVGRS